MLSEEQRNDIKYAIPVPDSIDIEGSQVMADCGQGSTRLLDYIYDRNGGADYTHKRSQTRSSI